MTDVYPSFPKIPRWFNDVTITEKIDGSNGLVSVREREPYGPAYSCATVEGSDGVVRTVRAGSRSQWVTPGKNTDNYGFAAWVYDNAAALARLGPGNHYGEWWGSAIQRRYGFRNGERFFSLFDVRKAELVAQLGHPQIKVVPVLFTGAFAITANGLGLDPVSDAMRRLSYSGSLAAPGFADPEGVMVFHHAAKQYFKAPFSENKRA